jgi:hypothetical protein
VRGEAPLPLLGEAPGPGPTRRREWERATTATSTTSGSALGPTFLFSYHACSYSL